MGDIVPRKTLVKQGSQGFGGVVGGIVLLALRALNPVASLIVGGIIALTGLGISRSPEDRTVGLITLAAGAITAVTAIPAIGGLAGFLMTVSGIGLIVAGGLNLYKFIKGYRNRL